MTKRIIIALAILVVVAATLTANGAQDNYEQGSGQGLQDGSGQGMGNGQGARDGSGRGAGQGKGGGQGRNSSGESYHEDFIQELSEVYNIEPGSGIVTDREIDGLMLMREEEKLARDVYNSLYEKWNLPIFRNIAESEQQHMDAVKLLLDAYKLDDPINTDVPGVFKNSELQNYYDNLVKQGSESTEAALNVGALIEDLDIADLQKLINEADNDELKIMYQNLMKGSRNHMRSFVAQLERYDLSYEPEFIDDDYYGKILKYNREMAPISDPDYSL